MATQSISWRGRMADEKKGFNLQSCIETAIQVATIGGLLFAGVIKLANVETGMQTANSALTAIEQKTDSRDADQYELMARFFEHVMNSLPQSKVKREAGQQLIKEARDKSAAIKAQQNLITNGNGPAPVRRKE